MKKFNTLLKIYYSIPNFENSCVLSKALNVISARILKKLFDKRIDLVLDSSNNKRLSLKKTDLKRPSPLIASLTSFPARIENANISLECIFSQSVQPDRIILWLAKEQFPNQIASLPQKITSMISRGLEIRFCEDLKSHKKYYYTIQENPNAFIVTFDDDLYYPTNIIENLLTLYKKYPKNVIATRAHKMQFEGNKLKSYSKWLHNYNEEKSSLHLMHTSGAGTLFPPNLNLDDTFFDKELLMKLSPNSDDVWMKVNLIRLGIPVVTNSTFNKDPITIRSAFRTSLVKTNSFEGGKDEQLKKTIDFFNIKFNAEKYK